MTQIDIVDEMFSTGFDAGFDAALNESSYVQINQQQAKVIQDLTAKVAELEDELERERIRLAACGVAALGYFDGCKDEYRSASLDDTLRLYESYTNEQHKVRALTDALTTCVCAMQDYQAGIGITEMFDEGERLGREALATVKEGK